MVKSGLDKNLVEEIEGGIPRVSPYRLAAHLTCAFALFTGLVHTGLGVLQLTLTLTRTLTRTLTLILTLTLALTLALALALTLTLTLAPTLTPALTRRAAATHRRHLRGSGEG